MSSVKVLGLGAPENWGPYAGALATRP
uniref:Uncharacterized protein n=1 Tax=Oryza glumipatula TaxID=40148 RepID=A0A0E0ARM3_9ORYZ